MNFIEITVLKQKPYLNVEMMTTLKTKNIEKMPSKKSCKPLPIFYPLWMFGILTKKYENKNYRKNLYVC